MKPLPPGWAWATVGKVATEVRSGFASGKHNPSGEGIPHLRPMNVSRDGEVILDKVKYVSPDIDKRRLCRGDILFNNTNSPALVGKTALFELEGEFAFSNHMTRVRTTKMVPGFVAHQLHYSWMTGRLSSFINNHVNQASISARVLASQIHIAIAPIPEQWKIVQRIDKMFASLGAVEATLQSLISRLSLLRSAILADSFHTYSGLPSSWTMTTIGELCDINPRFSKASFSDDQLVTFIPMSAVEAETCYADVSEIRTMRELRNGSYRGFREGDVLVAKITPSMENGKVAVAENLVSGWGIG